VPIFIALDRSGVVSHKVLECNTKEKIQAQLKPLLSSGSVLCIDGNISYKGIAEELSIDHKRLIALDNRGHLSYSNVKQLYDALEGMVQTL